MANTNQNDKQETPRVCIRCMLCGWGAETLTQIMQHMVLKHQERTDELNLRTDQPAPPAHKA